MSILSVSALSRIKSACSAPVCRRGVRVLESMAFSTSCLVDRNQSWELTTTIACLSWNGVLGRSSSFKDRNHWYKAISSLPMVFCLFLFDTDQCNMQQSITVDVIVEFIFCQEIAINRLAAVITDHFARFLNWVYSESNKSLTVPTGPLRCLATITSAIFLSAVSGL